MRIFRHYNALPKDARGGAVAVGNFDGVHRGHQIVIGEAGLIAKAEGVPFCVLTFEPHPRSLFTPKNAPFRLTSFRAKARYLKKLGVENLVVLRFDKAFSQRQAEDFVHDVLVGGLNAHHVVSGYDFVFGKGRKGDCALLLKMGENEGFDFTAVAAIHGEDDEVYSSTRVRQFLRSGDIAAARDILGRGFEIEGRVEKGDGRGRTIGWPTANLPISGLCPAQGVYAVRVTMGDAADSVWYDGVANLGCRPTFAGDGVIFEVHIFDFDEDIYDRRLRVKMVSRLRPEKTFDGVDALKAQIALDAEQARRLLARDKLS
jgi:riboflavin kinase / FMN adenylyltransferase